MIYRILKIRGSLKIIKLKIKLITFVNINYDPDQLIKLFFIYN
jgi:hypothetical protein